MRTQRESLASGRARVMSQTPNSVLDHKLKTRHLVTVHVGPAWAAAYAGSESRTVTRVRRVCGGSVGTRAELKKRERESRYKAKVAKRVMRHQGHVNELTNPADAPGYNCFSRRSMVLRDDTPILSPTDVSQSQARQSLFTAWSEMSPSGAATSGAAESGARRGEWWARTPWQPQSEGSQYRSALMARQQALFVPAARRLVDDLTLTDANWRAMSCPPSVSITRCAVKESH